MTGRFGSLEHLIRDGHLRAGRHLDARHHLDDFHLGGSRRGARRLGD